MGIFDNIEDKISQTIKNLNTAHIYTEQCSKILSGLHEIFFEIHQNSEFRSKESTMNSILDLLNNLNQIIVGFSAENWFQTSISITPSDQIQQISDVMNSISEELKTVNISLTKEYTADPKSVINDLNNLGGNLTDPVLLQDPRVQEKLNDIDQYKKALQVKKKKLKRRKSSKRKSKSKSRASSSTSLSNDDDSTNNSNNNSDLSNDSSENVSFDEDDDIVDLDTFDLKRLSLIKDKTIVEENASFIVYTGKLKKTIENVNITVFNDIPDIEEKFKRLVSVLTAAQHPNLESFVGAVKEPPYIVVTRRFGDKLSDILKRSKGKKKSEIPEGYKTTIAFNIAKAMAYLHSMNIIHRDLSSDNVTIDKNYNPRITNFLSSRFIPEENFFMSIQTKCYFKAPEVDDTYDESIDVFAFAGILYELLTETRPFDKLDPFECAALIDKNERPPLPQNISSDLKELIEKCWSQRPKDRPTFSEVIDTMLTKRITFPSDEDSQIAVDFYDERSIQNSDLDSCLQLLKDIAADVSNSFVYAKETIRVRSFLYGYQSLLQTFDISSFDGNQLFNIQTQLTNLKSFLEDLRSVILQTESNRWSKIGLITPVKEIPKNIHSFMERIYVSMKALDFKVSKYDFVNCDLVSDFRFLNRIYNETEIDPSEFENRDKRKKEIIHFLEKRDLEIEVTPDEKNERFKKLFSQFRNHQLKRDDFEIVGKPVGSGVTSSVFKARQKTIPPKEVAIKILEKDFGEDERTTELLRREISFLVKLHHEYLINFIGFIADPGEQIWIVSEFAEDGTLYDAKKKLTPFQKTKIAFEIAEGMEYIHKNHIIHRDLKTLNVLLDGDTPKISDFGFSRFDISLSMTRKIGTIQYMAPEVIKGSHYDLKADVFSFAMILWELYYSAVPFIWINSRMEIENEILNKNANLLYHKPISDDLKQLIEDCKKNSPKNRPTFTDIIQIMIDKKIAFHKSDPDQVNEFYRMKKEKRENMLNTQK